MLTVTLLTKKFLASDKPKGLLVFKDPDQVQALLPSIPIPSPCFACL
jgi:hypothetical protein